MNKVKLMIPTMLFYVLRIFPIKRNKIVFCSFLGRGYGAEGKLICDKIISQEYDIVWLVRDINDYVPEGIRKVKYLSLKSIYEQATAKIWIDNRRKAPYVRKRNNQYYFQLWHGDVCIKHVEKDAENKLPKIYVRSAKNDSRMANYFLAGSKWRKNNYLKSFWYHGPILEGDLYRSYFDTSNINKINKCVREYFNIDNDLRIVLYAPTFRQNHDINCYDINFERLLFELRKKWGGSWCVIVRLHPNVSYLCKNISYSKYVINGTDYPQINDLIISSDILITDFSGCMFEGFRSKKIVLLYASDFYDYLENERDVYFDFCSLPSPIAKDNQELATIITNFDPEEYERKRKDFVDNIGYYSEDGVEIIINKIKEIMR